MFVCKELQGRAKASAYQWLRSTDLGFRVVLGGLCNQSESFFVHPEN